MGNVKRLSSVVRYPLNSDSTFNPVAVSLCCVSLGLRCGRGATSPLGVGRVPYNDYCRVGDTSPEVLRTTSRHSVDLLRERGDEVKSRFLEQTT